MPVSIQRRTFFQRAGAASLAAVHVRLHAALTDGNLSAAEQIIEGAVDSGKLKSAVLLVQEGSRRIVRSYGVDPDAIFLIASITKPMTATGVMVLADRGELKLSDPVMRFIPEFRVGDRREITIKHLLTHTSGLPDQVPENTQLRQRHAPLSEFVKVAIRTPLHFKPGTRYSYQSMGILLASEIVRRITKTEIAPFLAREVFKPLGMKRTALGLGRFKLDEVVRSQTQSAAPESGSGAAAAKNWDWNSQYWRALGAPWGGVHSTAVDVTLFMRSFLHPENHVLHPATARSMIRDHNSGLSNRRGIGFDLGPDGLGESLSKQSFGHSGSTGTLAWADPKTDRSFVLLTALPARASRKTIINPVSDLLSG
jgi:CubicO group peptidase (beta-lactamase class C family)